MDQEQQRVQDFKGKARAVGLYVFTPILIIADIFVIQRAGTIAQVFVLGFSFFPFLFLVFDIVITSSYIWSNLDRKYGLVGTVWIVATSYMKGVIHPLVYERYRNSRHVLSILRLNEEEDLLKERSTLINRVNEFDFYIDDEVFGHIKNLLNPDEINRKRVRKCRGLLNRLEREEARYEREFERQTSLLLEIAKEADSISCTFIVEVYADLVEKYKREKINDADLFAETERLRRSLSRFRVCLERAKKAGIHEESLPLISRGLFDEFENLFETRRKEEIKERDVASFEERIMRIAESEQEKALSLLESVASCPFNSRDYRKARYELEMFLSET